MKKTKKEKSTKKVKKSKKDTKTFKFKTDVFGNPLDATFGEDLSLLDLGVPVK
jgi:hypothetical protein